MRNPFIFTIMILLVSLSISKPLTKETIDYLKADQEVLDIFHHNLRQMSCKLIAYSKIKSLYDSEEIDSYLNKTRYKRSFLNAFYDDLWSRCNKNIDDDKLVFNGTLYEKYDDNLQANHLIEGFNITQIVNTINWEKDQEKFKEEL